MQSETFVVTFCEFSKYSSLNSESSVYWIVHWPDWSKGEIASQFGSAQYTTGVHGGNSRQFPSSGGKIMVQAVLQHTSPQTVTVPDGQQVAPKHIPLQHLLPQRWLSFGQQRPSDCSRQMEFLTQHTEPHLWEPIGHLQTGGSDNCAKEKMVVNIVNSINEKNLACIFE